MTDFDYLLACGPTSEVKEALSKVELATAAARADKNPTPAQAEAGNYRHGHITWKGLDIAIETPKGAYRRGVDKEGKSWATLMKDHYGRIKQTEGADGDQVDIFLCDDDLESEVVFVVNQVNHEGFDEHKVCIGTTNEARAREVYLRNYSKGWSGLGPVTAMTADQFKWWLEHADMSREIKDGFWAAKGNLKKAEDEEVIRLARYKCPHCGGTNAFNGDPSGGTMFRGSAHCYDCNEGFSVCSPNGPKPVGKGPVAYEKHGPDWRNKTAGENCPHCDTPMKRGDDGCCNHCGKPWPVKIATEYRLGGTVQGVHLRATLHQILDQMKVKGLAYNDARTNTAYALIDADEPTRANVMAALAAKLQANKKVQQVSVEPVEKEEALQPVDLDDKALEHLFTTQGFKVHPTDETDPIAYRRQWVQKRYRLQSDPKTNHMTGSVPALAYKQLTGQEPVYHGQLTQPDRFGNKDWTGGMSTLPEKAADDTDLDDVLDAILDRKERLVPVMMETTRIMLCPEDILEALMEKDDDRDDSDDE